MRSIFKEDGVMRGGFQLGIDRKETSDCSISD